jgi:hypothetical protein
MAMGGITGIDLIIIIMFRVMETVVEVVITIVVVMLVVVKITTAKHLILNLFQAQIDLPIQQLLKSQGNKIIV